MTSSSFFFAFFVSLLHLGISPKPKRLQPSSSTTSGQIRTCRAFWKRWVSHHSALRACAFYSAFLPFTPLSGISEKRDWLWPKQKAAWRSVKETDGLVLRRTLKVCFCVFVSLFFFFPRPAARDVQVLLRQWRHHGGTQGGSGGRLSRRRCARVAQVFIHILDTS